jgi:arabinose-5-phosphate isomerase
VSGSSPPPAEPAPFDPQAIAAGRSAIEAAGRAVESVRTRFDGASAALPILLGATGRVIVTGLGKSGMVANKLAATLSSTGTRAQFLHAGDALHGDVGCIGDGDVVIAVSNSGETEEVCCIAELAVERQVPVIALTGCGGRSPLAASATVHLDVGVECEGDPYDLVPSASTTAVMVLGDALAIALMVARGFGAEDFRRCHPSGALGRRAGHDRATHG